MYTTEYLPDSFGYDEFFLNKYGIQTLVLKDSSSTSKLLIAPGLQCRVMTSTAAGDSGYSFGWINYELIRSGIPQEHIHVFGGEERLWLGPEGGPFSFYFAPGNKQVFDHWYVPKELDTIGFRVFSKGENELLCGTLFNLMNASGFRFRMSIERHIRVMELSEIKEKLNIDLGPSMKIVAYETKNTLYNRGDNPWDEESGAPSLWMLCMLKPSEQTNIYLPYSGKNNHHKPVNDNYFGKISPSRLLIEDGMAILRADGRSRGKIGISQEYARDCVVGISMDKKTITMLNFSLPDKPSKYVNSQWGDQDDPFNGDAVNAYNDGPLEDGSQLGPFYELESSSPAAFLDPGESTTHIQEIFHFEGSDEDMEKLSQDILNKYTCQQYMN